MENGFNSDMERYGFLQDILHQVSNYFVRDQRQIPDGYNNFPRCDVN